MRIITLLPLAVIATALVIPDDTFTNQIFTKFQEESKSLLDKLPDKEDVLSQVREAFSEATTFSGNALDTAIHAAIGSGKKALAAFERHSTTMTAFDADAWLDSEASAVEDIEIFESEEKPQLPHHKELQLKKPKRKRPHRGRSNLTIYELINSSKYTTKFAKLVNEFDDIVGFLNSTNANRTLFVPTDAAFEKLPDHIKKPSKDLIRKILSYHASPGFYPTPRILVSHTLPSAWNEEAIGNKAQRLRVRLTLKGLTVNLYSHVIAPNIVSHCGPHREIPY
jgi:uncharacterized surface protein with fasciclin (FAS1) repeats